MNTKEYWGLEFTEFVKQFDLTDEELLDLVQTYSGDAPLEIIRKGNKIYIV